VENESDTQPTIYQTSQTIKTQNQEPAEWLPALSSIDTRQRARHPHGVTAGAAASRVR
jgi:hypothetical protein